ncbi:hypothetical protein [Xylanibacter muris]|uniref:Uncharacterized protein n=2 Tax=Xylanibacter muris TaxID=2736290 RepID=A0ABX2AJG6_9BACT|nr:hypothetical protein [Xylanibacter muris]NPD91276.1 hypothetical protein [Xylanibacter muris]
MQYAYLQPPANIEQYKNKIKPLDLHLRTGKEPLQLLEKELFQLLEKEPLRLLGKEKKPLPLPEVFNIFIIKAI